MDKKKPETHKTYNNNRVSHSHCRIAYRPEWNCFVAINLSKNGILVKSNSTKKNVNNNQQQWIKVDSLE